MRSAAALIIGNELLSGKIADANVVVLARALRSAGVVFRRVVMVLDEIDTIAAEVLALSGSHDVVFTSGGVGPTHDDVTIDAVAAAFGVPVESSSLMEGLLREYYGERLLPDHLLMARMPSGARLVSSPSMPWPAVVMKNVWVLPGVPEIFQSKIPLILSDLGTDKPFVSFSVLTTLDEGAIKPMLDSVVSAFPHIQIGSYPRFGGVEYRTKLTFDGLDPSAAKAAADAFAASLPEETIVRVG